jgi:hypothetical protein
MFVCQGSPGREARGGGDDRGHAVGPQLCNRRLYGRHVRDQLVAVPQELDHLGDLVD